MSDRYLLDIVRGATARAAEARRAVRLAYAAGGASAAERAARELAGAPAVHSCGAAVYYIDGWRVLTRTRHETETY